MVKFQNTRDKEKVLNFPREKQIIHWVREWGWYSDLRLLISNSWWEKNSKARSLKSWWEKVVNIDFEWKRHSHGEWNRHFRQVRTQKIHHFQAQFERLARECPQQETKIKRYSSIEKQTRNDWENKLAKCNVKKTSIRISVYWTLTMQTLRTCATNSNFADGHFQRKCQPTSISKWITSVTS